MQNIVTREPRVSTLPAQREGVTHELYAPLSAIRTQAQKAWKPTKGRSGNCFLFQRPGVTHPLRENILQYRAFLRQKGLCPTNVQNYLTAVRFFFRWTAQEGLYRNVAERVKGSVVSKENRKDYLTSSQDKDLLASIPRDSKGGLRVIEVTWANVGDLRVAGDHTVLYLQGKGKEEKTEFAKMEPLWKPPFAPT